MMLSFADDHDARYSLAVGGVHTLPGGRRLGIVSISRSQVVIAFVGSDPDWTGGITLRIGDTVRRGGLRLRLHQVGHDWLGQRTAEFEVTTSDASSSVKEPASTREQQARAQDSGPRTRAGRS